MSFQEIKLIWRCANCSNHLADIIKARGVLQINKKCSKCKSINLLSILNGEVSIRCNSDKENENHETLSI